MLCCWRLVLLLGSLFLARAFDSEEQQKEDEAMEIMSLADPGPPQNVLVEVEGPTSLYLSWEPPDRRPKYFTVGWEDKEETTFNTSFLATELEPCERYIFLVTSVYGDDIPPSPELSTSASGTTDVAEPPAPGPCDFYDIATSSLSVGWTAPSTSCLVANYTVTWTWDNLWNGLQGSGRAIATATHTSVSDLQPFTKVTVEVTAATEAGLGPSTTCWNVTQTDEPGPPSMEEVVPLRGSANVTWSVPEEANGIIDEYQVEFRDGEGSPGNETVAGTVLTTLVEDLAPCESYSFRVRAKTVAGWGPFSEASEEVILGEVPVNNISCGVDHRNVQVCWQSLHTKCPVKWYNIRWTGNVLWNNETLTGSDRVPWEEEEEVCHVLQETVPYTDYTICVTADDFSNGSRCCSETSPQERPGPPSITDLEGPHRRAVLVTWSDPDAKNGVIDRYLIRWADSGGESRADSVGGDECSYEIADLDPCETYEIAVKGHTKGGWGQESEGESTDIPNFILETNCTSEEPRKVELKWILGSSDCSVSQYLLLWNTSVLWANESSSGNEILDGMENSYVFSDLEPYTRVTSCLSIEGTDDENICCSTTSLQEEPSKPRDLEVVNTTFSTAFVRWYLPERPNGVLRKWRLKWSSDNESVGDADLEASLLHYTIVHLRPDTTYYVDVRASTEAGFGDAAGAVITTEGRRPQKTGLIIGASVGGGLLLVAVIAAGGTFAWKRHKSSKRPSSEASEPSVEMAKSRDNHDTYSSDLYNHQQEWYQEQQSHTVKSSDTKSLAETFGRYTLRRMSD